MDSVSIGSKRVNIFDEDVNYINYEEIDETDELFNRNLFDDDEGDGDGDYEYRAPKGLELDDYEYKAPRSLELDDYEDGGDDVDEYDGYDDDYNEEEEEDYTIPVIEINDMDHESNKSIHSDNNNELSKELLEIINNKTQQDTKLKSIEINLKPVKSSILRNHRSIKFHHLSSDIEDKLSLKDENDKEDNNGDDNRDEIWKNLTALDEVNSIPEECSFINRNKNRFSTILVNEEENNDSNEEDNDKKSKGHHLWKNLIMRKESKIELNDKTITLYNRYEESNDDNEEEGNEEGELSTIME